VIATVLDTGPIVAALNATDRRHLDCARLLMSMRGRRLLPSPVLTEVCWLLERWPDVEAAFLEETAHGAFELIHLAPVDLARMAELVRHYAAPSERSTRQCLRWLSASVPSGSPLWTTVTSLPSSLRTYLP
jgi:predicted nucleic acid-binding protein